MTFDLPFSSGSGLETMIFWPQMETNNKYRFAPIQTWALKINKIKPQHKVMT